MPEDTLRATIHATTASIPAATWNGLLPATAGVPDNPFLEHAFFLALEESGCATRRTGWQPQHILLEDEAGEALGLMPLFLKSHSQGEYVFDHGWADAFERAGGSYYPKLQGSIPFTPVTAPKLLVPTEDEALKLALLTTAGTLCQRIEASSVHATFVPEDELALAVGADWLVRHDTQFHWHNQGFSSFDDFLETLSSRHRKQIRRERRDALADGLAVKWLSGRDLTEAAWDAFYDFYEDTGGRKWGRPYLNRKFFSLLGQYLGDRVVLIMAYDGPHAVAGALNLAGTTTLYGRNWGCNRHVPFLHFEVCYYQAIDYAIAHKLKVVEAGAQGEHKLARGYEPTTTRSIHWIANRSLRRAISDYLVRERASVAHDQEVLDHYTPFRKGEIRNKKQGDGVATYAPDNIFAKIIGGAIPSHKVFEDADVLAIMDVFPQSRGHTLVIPKIGSRNLLDADPRVLSAVIPTVQKIARAVVEATQADGFRLVQFNEEPAGQTVFHLHFHIIPAYAGQQLGRHGAGGRADDAELAALAKDIASRLA